MNRNNGILKAIETVGKWLDGEKGGGIKPPPYTIWGVWLALGELITQGWTRTYHSDIKDILTKFGMMAEADEHGIMYEISLPEKMKGETDAAIKEMSHLQKRRV